MAETMNQTRFFERKIMKNIIKNNILDNKSSFLPPPFAFILFIALSLLAYGGMIAVHGLHGTLRDGYVPQTIGWYLLAFVAYLGALVWVERRGGVNMRWVWAAGIVFRLLLLFTVPTLSDDVYRYMWDGYVANNGVSPYAYAIEAAELDYLDIPQRRLANNSWMASPYLPVAQYLFFGLTFLFPLDPIFMQLAMVIIDLLSAFLLAKLLALAELPPLRLLIYLWNPLVIVEVAHGAHVDAWMICLMLVAIWLTWTSGPPLTPPNTRGGTDNSPEPCIGRRGWGVGARSKAYLAPLFLALATLTKIIPVLLLPIFFWRFSWRQLILYGTVCVGLLIPAGLRAGWGLTGELNGRGLFGALRIYSAQWNFNSGIFHWLEEWLAQSGALDPFSISKNIILGLMLLTLLLVWLAARRQTSLLGTLRLMSIPYMAYLLLATTVHPWYALSLMIFLPFLPPNAREAEQRLTSFARWFTIVPWLYLSGALIFSYLTYLDPLNFGEREWIRQTEWLPTLALWLLSVLVWGGNWVRERNF